MFERYTEKARRVIFFARYEASQLGSPQIEAEHLLLGILREDKALTNRILPWESVESIRTRIETHAVVREKVATSVDLPLADDAKRILARAAEEAERMAHKQIGTEHLLLGILREEHSFARQLLVERDVRIDQVRKDVAATSSDTTSRVTGLSHGSSSPSSYPIVFRLDGAPSGESIHRLEDSRRIP